MAHFLLKHERRARWVTRTLAAVTVRVVRRGGQRTLVVQTADEVERPIGMLKTGVSIAPLPEGVRVLDSEGDAIPPSRRFWVTTDTIDPFHMLIDTEDP